MNNNPITSKTEVKTFMVKVYCPECKNVGFDNELIQSKEWLMTCPPQYKYTCECGYETTSTENYPKLITEEIINE